MGVGVPGIVQHGDGVVAWAPAQQWRDFPLKSRLVELYDFPILIENDINLAALGELWGGFGLNTQNIIVLSVDRGIGCGIIIDRILYRGSNGAAGEVGSLLVGCDSLDHKSEMARALEGVASPAAVMDRARAALKNRQPPYDLDRLTPADVIHAAQEGESWAQPIISEMVDYLSVAVGNLTIILNPDVIVLTGSVFESSKYLANQIRNRIQGAIPVVPRLVMSSLGRQAVVMGAIAGILYPNPDDSRLRKLP